MHERVLRDLRDKTKNVVVRDEHLGIGCEWEAFGGTGGHLEVLDLRRSGNH